MPCNCTLIALEDFIGPTPMPENIDSKRVLPSVLDVQETYIRPLLCDDLYDEICEQKSAGTLTALNQTLLDDYIKPVLIRYAFGDFLKRQSITVTKESVVRKMSDESEFPDFAAVKELAKTYFDYGQTYAAKLTEYLDDNSDDYPLWCGSDDCDDFSVSNFSGFF